MKNQSPGRQFLYSVPVLILSLCLVGCLSSSDAGFGAEDSPFAGDNGAGIDAVGGGAPSGEFVEGQGWEYQDDTNEVSQDEDAAGGESGEESEEESEEESGDEAGDESGDEAGDESGDEAGDEAGEESGDEAGDEAGDESGEESGDESGDVPEGGEASPPAGFCAQYTIVCGEWNGGEAACADWWALLEAGEPGAESGASKECSWTHLAWAENAIGETVQEYCAAAAGQAVCVEEPESQEWDINDYVECSPQDQAELDAYVVDIFEKSCAGGGCHGPAASKKGTLQDILDFEGLVSSTDIIPGNPVGSHIYQRIADDQMPPAGPLAPDEKDKVYQWIACYELSEAQNVVSMEEVHEILKADIDNTKSSTRKNIRYISLVHLYNAGAGPEQLQTYREAIDKLLNSLTWRDKIQQVSYADPQELIARVDISELLWDEFPLAVPGLEGTNVWTQVADAYPYKVSQEDDDSLEYVVDETETNVPIVYADWFVANASVPPLYHDILGLPGTLNELETMLGVDVKKNLTVQSEVVRAGVLDSGVSANNRILERHPIEDDSDSDGKLIDYEGAFWLSYDFASNTGKQNIISHPFDFEEDGGEVIFNLPNGLQAYYICDAEGVRLDTAPTAIVKDDNPGFEGETIVNGRSCMKCHFEGMRDAKDVVSENVDKFPPAVAGSITAIYDPVDFEEKLAFDKALFAESMEDAGVPLVEEALDEQVFLMSERHVVDMTGTDISAHMYMSWDEVKSHQGVDRLKGISELADFFEDEGADGEIKANKLKRETFDATYNDFVCALEQGEPINPETGETGCTVVSICNEIQFGFDTTLVINGVELAAPVAGSCSDCRAFPSGDAIVATLTVSEEDFLGLLDEENVVQSVTTQILKFEDDADLVIKIGGNLDPANPSLEVVEMIGAKRCEDNIGEL